MAKTYEMAIAIKGMLDGSFGSSFKAAQNQMKGLNSEVRSLSRQMKDAQKVMEAAAKTTAAPIYEEARKQVAAYQKQLQDLGDQQKSLRNAMDAKQDASDRFGQAKGRLSGAATTVGVAAAPLAAATVAAVQFESAMADVRKVVDFETPQQFKEMNADILALSQSLPMSAEGIAQIVAAGGQSGIAREDLMAFAQDAVKMGIAFDITADQAGEMMAKWRTAFAMSQDEVVTLADKVNYLSNVTAASSGDISDIVTRVGPLGEVAGVNAGQIAAMGASMAGVGVQSEIAATGIKNMMLGLVSGASATKSQAEAFAALGLNATDVAQRMQTDAQGTIIDVLTRIRELPKEAQAANLKDLFGSESISAIAPLLTQLDNLKTNFDRVGAASQYAGSMQAEYEARAGTTANQLQLTKNNIMALAVSIGSVLLPPLNELLSSTSTVIGTMADWAAQNPEITSGLLTVAGTVAGLVLTMLTVNAAVAGWNNLRASINLFIQTTKLAAAASRAMGLAMAMTPMGMAVVAIAAVVAGILYLWNTSEGFRDFVMSLPHDIVFAIGVIAGVMMSLPGVVYDVVVSIGAFLPMLPAYCIEAGAEFVAAAGQWASEAYDAIMNWISQLPDAISNAISSAWENIKATFSAGVTVGVNTVEAGKSASGGVFTNPYLTWVAEAGHPEVIVPITHDQNAYNLLGTAARMLGVPSMSMPSISAPSPGGGGINVTYAPVINVSGSGDTTQLSAMLEQERRKLEAMLQRITDQQRRLSYG
ncbi:phage tail tape measure protein [Megasphaera stantonii]|uniref:phage tail tape measure protein n=1 Tax=Megasphaera stantonii TaxID=2144175 RepID=UPI00320909E7